MPYIDKLKARGVTYDIQASTLSGVTATASEINVLDGITASTTELNYVTGVTSAIQTQMDTKAPKASPALTGTPTAPTAATGTNTTQIATTAFVQNTLSIGKAMTYEGTVSSSKSLPSTHYVGDTYIVEEAGTYAGVSCSVGDMILCNTSGTTSTDSHWNVIHCGDGTGKVAPSGSFTVGHIVNANNTDGTQIVDSGYTIATSVPSGAVFTDTTYSISSGGNTVTLTPSTGTATTVNTYSKNWGSYTFASGSWTSSSGWYTQTLSITGMTGDYYPTMIPTYTSASDVTTMQEAMAKIAYITTDSGSITAYATEAPTAAITFSLVGM